MGVTKYQADGRMWWRVDDWLVKPDGSRTRYRKKRIPTKEQALMLASKVKAEAFEGRFFDRVRAPTLTVQDVWELYEPVTTAENDSWQSDAGRAKTLLRHLGSVRVSGLTIERVDEFRRAREREKTRRGPRPSPQTIDHEVALLKRIINYAVNAGRLPANPIAKAHLQRKPNVRLSIIAPSAFEKLVAVADDWLKPVLWLAYTTGMRQREVLDLIWPQVNLERGTLTLAPQSTKEEKPRLVFLTPQVASLLRQLERDENNAFVFPSSETGKPWNNIRWAFRRACKKAGLSGYWFHDLRRSFITLGRRSGIAESVLMRMSGHRTREVFDRYNVVAEEDLVSAVAVIQDTFRTQSSKEDAKNLDREAQTSAVPIT